MNDVAIRVEGLSKQYRIGGKRERYQTLRDKLTDAFAAPLRRAGQFLRGQASDAAELNETIWALKDVSFEVKRGEVLGVIGRNGAGKSTLLKILSRITEPTEGYAEVRGRVGSLLEVGTGFHPELTGRENIYLNGAILGMRRADIERRFDEIVAFAETEKFLDTPVKHYSSGMHVRLAFAVAAHLEPEILLVDEVLAVGDQGFQRKCLGKMAEVAEGGRTVLFVSHNLAAVRSLCSRGMVLDSGKILFGGGVAEAICDYQKSLRSCGEVDGRGREVEFTDVRINNGDSWTVACGQAFEIGCRLHLRSALPGFRLFCTIQDGGGEIMAVARTDNRELEGIAQPGSHRIRAHFPGLWLRPGVYSLHLKLLANTLHPGKARFVSDNVMLDVSGDVLSDTPLGYLAPAVTWSVEK